MGEQLDHRKVEIRGSLYLRMEEQMCSKNKESNGKSEQNTFRSPAELFFFPKEIKVDAVAHTGPLQDWAWQHLMGEGS